MKEFGIEIYGSHSLFFWLYRFIGDILLFLSQSRAVAHEEFKKINLKDMKELMNNAPVLIDVRGMFDAEEAKRKGFYYKAL